MRNVIINSKNQRFDIDGKNIILTIDSRFSLFVTLSSFFISFDRNNKIKKNSKNILQFRVSNFTFNHSRRVSWEMEAYQNFDTNKIYV